MALNTDEEMIAAGIPVEEIARMRGLAGDTTLHVMNWHPNKPADLDDELETERVYGQAFEMMKSLATTASYTGYHGTADNMAQLLVALADIALQLVYTCSYGLDIPPVQVLENLEKARPRFSSGEGEGTDAPAN